ncbi:MAG: glycosyltransferase [Dysgonamonadaceae bacterium]|nr:glycosyltransferase [Dysgonamonadaceae bacterium]
MMLAPIILFTYNRPAHTRQTLEALLNNKLCAESELFIFSDGYKNDSDKNDVLEVREIIRSIDGFKHVHLFENEKNIGLAQNVINGVSQVVNEYGKVIVLEDDLLTSPYFLIFMNEALEKFANEEQIGHIQGYCFSLPNLPDAFLIKWTGSWGWATWKRAWQKFNPDGQQLLNELKQRKLTKTFDFNGNYPFTRMLQRQINGENNSWAIRWNASLFLNDMLSVNAGKSLVKNIGFDGSGIHSGKEDIWATKLYDEKLNIDVISEICENENARKTFEGYYGKVNGFWTKVRRRLS